MKICKIKSIIEIGEEETIDIEVSGNNLFYANGILTHNSGFNNSDIEITDTSECIAITEKVTMRDGNTKSINDVKLGDQIKANDDYKTVMFRHHNKLKECVKITTQSGKSIIVSKDHVFPCKTKNGVERISVNTGLNINDILSTKI